MTAEPSENRAAGPYWEAVERCLIEFHKLEPRSARKRLARFRTAIAHEKLIHPEIVFHNEPFYLACDLTGTQLEMSDNQDRYTKILQEVQS